MIALAILLAMVMGVTLGLLGAGGAILSVPILRYIVGFDAKQAIGASLAVVAVTSLIGAWRYWQAGYVRPRIAFPFAFVSMTGAFAGARIARHLDGRTQLLLFSVLMLSAALSMLRPSTLSGTAMLSIEDQSTWRCVALCGGLALCIGLLTGLAGIGGGFIIVPGLIAVAGLPMREAAGTSLVATTLNAAFGLLGYLDQLVIPWGFLSTFTLAAALGILFGTFLVRFIDPSHLRRGFAILLLFMGTAMLIEHWDAVVVRSGDAPGRAGQGAWAEQASFAPEPRDLLSRHVNTNRTTP